MGRLDLLLIGDSCNDVTLPGETGRAKRQFLAAGIEKAANTCKLTLDDAKDRLDR